MKQQKKGFFSFVVIQQTAAKGIGLEKAIAKRYGFSLLEWGCDLMWHQFKFLDIGGYKS